MVALFLIMPSLIQEKFFHPSFFSLQVFIKKKTTYESYNGLMEDVSPRSRERKRQPSGKSHTHRHM